MFFGEHETYVLPAYPTEQVIDPTGAGDSFAGGMMGYLAEQDNFEPETLKTAMAYGILVASFNVEGFGVERMQGISRDDIESRMSGISQDVEFLDAQDPHVHRRRVAEGDVHAAAQTAIRRLQGCDGKRQMGSARKLALDVAVSWRSR